MGHVKIVGLFLMAALCLGVYVVPGSAYMGNGWFAFCAVVLVLVAISTDQ